MAQTLFHKSRLLSLLTIGALALSALAYGCSDDDDDSTTTPATKVDGGGTDAPASGDTGTASDTGSKTDTGPGVDAAVPTAVATIAPTADGGTVQGTATFTESSGSTTVNVTISGAEAGLHGLHIHMGNSCDPDDAGVPGNAAGGHWNPDDAGHAFPDASTHHAGDMGNIDITDAGTGTLSLTNPTTLWTVLPGTHSVVGHAVIFHSGTDDGTTQPTGAAGGRLGCGVIQQTQ
jgi:Cu-Zn family superoxide dismutase